jgi:uncharacterized membrane protein YbhN (UPF0104 family)
MKIIEMKLSDLKIRKWLPIVFIIAALTIVAIYIVQNLEQLSGLFQVSLSTLLIMSLLSLLSSVGNGMINYFLYQKMGIPISFKNSFGLATINTLANHLPFSGGLIAKGVYLKKRFGLGYARYLSATGALFICFIATNGALGLVTLGIMSVFMGIEIPGLLIAGFGVMVSSILLLWFPIRPRFFPEAWREHIEKIEEGWQIFQRERGLIIKLIFVQVLSILVVAARFLIAYSIFSQSIDYIECVMFSSATILTRLVSIVPGGIGVREGIVAALGSFLGLDPGISFVAVGFERLVATLIILILGIYFSYKLSQDVLVE